MTHDWVYAGKLLERPAGRGLVWIEKLVTRLKCCLDGHEKAFDLKRRWVCMRCGRDTGFVDPFGEVGRSVPLSHTSEDCYIDRAVAPTLPGGPVGPTRSPEIEELLRTIVSELRRIGDQLACR